MILIINQLQGLSEMSATCDLLSGTLPEFVYKCAGIDRVATVFDHEKITFTFADVKKEMDTLAAGLLSTGLRPQDRVLICGSNTAHFFICPLACARADLIFSLMSPNFANAEQLKYALGEFRAIICFPANREAEFLSNLLNEIAPELIYSAKGRLCSKAVPKLTHVIMAEEEHKHAGTFTLSEIYGRSNREKIDKLPNFIAWDTHKLAALQFTSGISAPPKLVALTHYQLLNGCHAVIKAIGCNDISCICCALPLFKMPIFSLIGLVPFITNTRVIYPSPSPLPKFLFESVKKFQCTHLVSNAVALGLILRVAQIQNVRLPSIENIILLGDRIPSDVIKNIIKQFENVQKVMVEIRSLGIQANWKGINKQSGELYIKAFKGSKFLGYETPYEGGEEWIETGDVVTVDEAGFIEVITNKEDLIVDNCGQLIEHWLLEKAICSHNEVKGAQIVALGKKPPLYALIVLKNPQTNVDIILTDLIALCKNNKVCLFYLIFIQKLGKSRPTFFSLFDELLIL
ncbi:AMP-binding enzyme [Onchocerca flexuosa]|uniref:AMP-binding enzyme n=1 Tax=Onchocerca flexuosa TaxID=387005 RepID=A0A238BRD0_9BILA|nr:AMP-binding enzyme [Onchocerca flexuosa]